MVQAFRLGMWLLIIVGNGVGALAYAERGDGRCEICDPPTQQDPDETEDNE